MIDTPRSLVDVLADNDTTDDLRATVVRYRRQSGGSGGGDGMEPRVAKLEANVEHIQRDVADIKTDVREFRGDLRDVRERLVRLEEKVAHLPGKGFIVASVLLSLGVMAGLMTFQSQIQTLVGARPIAVTSTP